MKSRYVIFLIALIAVSSCGVVFGQQSPQSSAGSDSIRIDTSLVMVDGIVLNKRTKTVVGDLKREDFTIFENNLRQEITHFSREELPLSVVLLLDVSGSVQPIIEEVRSAALEALGNLKSRDSVATMIFGNRTKLVTHLTQDRQSIRDGLDDMWSSAPEVGYGTVITHAVYSASRYLRQRTRLTDRRAIILITDDEDFRYSVPPRDVVLRELHDSGAALCSIIVSHGKAARTAVNVGTTAAITAVNPILGGVLIGMKIFRKASSPGSTSRYFTENTGGVLVSAKKNEVGRVFIELMQLLRNRYTFGYEPPESPDDGRLRQIKLTVNEDDRRKKGELIVLARSGYYYTRPDARRPDPPVLALNNTPPASESPDPAETVRPLLAPAVVPGLPTLHRLDQATLSPSYSCRPPEDAGKGYQKTALFLSDHSAQRNTPDLLFNGSCGAMDYFVSATAGDDLSLIADLGDIPIENLTTSMAFRSDPAGSTENRFVRSVKVELNHTYAVLLNRSHQRGIFFFRVNGYRPNQKVELSYVVKHYQLTDVRDGSPGFDWSRGNTSPDRP